MVDENPYKSPDVKSEASEKRQLHPDWFIFTVAIMVFSMFSLLGVLSPKEDFNSSIIGFGRGFIVIPKSIGLTGFVILLPLLAIPPTMSIALPFRKFYWVNRLTDRSMFNFLMLVLGVVAASVNACLYRFG
ncbi:MAG: hypothetical protein AAGA30_09580 [Planctomycetota bacterium]